MAIYSNDGSIFMDKGDTGNIVFSGLPTDKAYQVYMSVYDEDNEKIIKEIQATTFEQSTGTATFVINRTISDSLTVGEFTYALKGCADGGEDTWIPEVREVDGSFVTQSAPTFVINPKRVEGTT